MLTNQMNTESIRYVCSFYPLHSVVQIQYINVTVSMNVMHMLNMSVSLEIIKGQNGKI